MLIPKDIGPSEQTVLWCILVLVSKRFKWY